MRRVPAGGGTSTIGKLTVPVVEPEVTNFVSADATSRRRQVVATSSA